MHWQRERETIAATTTTTTTTTYHFLRFSLLNDCKKWSSSSTISTAAIHSLLVTTTFILSPLARHIFPVSSFFALAFIHSTHTLRVRLLASMQQKQQQKPTTSTHKHKSACKTVCMHVHTRSIECGQISLLRAAFLKTFFDVNVSGRRSRWAVLRACTCYIRLLFGKVNLTSFFQVNNIWKQCI